MFSYKLVKFKNTPLVSSLCSKRFFKLPATYVRKNNFVKKLPAFQSLTTWLKALKPNRLAEVQDELLELMFPRDSSDNANVKIENTRVQIDDVNHINELSFQVINDASQPTKHIAFIHGYGASLGCFARNFSLINRLKGLKYNYKIHFLDNITFGLSSDPKIDSNLVSHWKVPSVPSIEMKDNESPEFQKLYRKYYKLVESYTVDAKEFESYKAKFIPILRQLEDFYVNAIEKWRIASKLEHIDFLVGHSYGGYWSASFASRHPSNLKNLILLSPVGVERHVLAVTNDTIKGNSLESFEPTLDPSSYKFLSRIPILSEAHIKNWFNYQPYLPRILRILGPWGVQKYYDMWYSKLFKINNLIDKRGGPEKTFTSENDLVLGTNKECQLIVEYLYNSISKGSHSDFYVKNLLTPSTTSKWPLFDKLESLYNSFPAKKSPFDLHFVYGQFDFMNSEAGETLVNTLDKKLDKSSVKYHIVSEAGHNLYIDNPFETNELIEEIVKADEASS